MAPFDFAWTGWPDAWRCCVHCIAYEHAGCSELSICSARCGICVADSALQHCKSNKAGLLDSGSAFDGPGNRKLSKQVSGIPSHMECIHSTHRKARHVPTQIANEL